MMITPHATGKVLQSLCLAGLLTFGIPLQAQEKTSYQTPPDEILKLVDAAPTPLLEFNEDGTQALMLERPGLSTIEDVSQPELRIGGIRINPANNGRSRSSYITNIKVLDVASGDEQTISGMPEDARIGSVNYSPDEKHVAFANMEKDGISLWVADLTSLEAKKLTDDRLNMALGAAISWLNDDALLIKTTLADGPDAPEAPTAPSGPVIQETSGSAAPSRTYQDLLQNPHDEALLAYYLESQLVKVQLDGSKSNVGTPGMIKSYQRSPDGKYLLTELIQEPFSYLVPVYRFPYNMEVWDADGNKVKDLAQIPLDEIRPTGFDATVTGIRNVSWRADKAATLYWAEAQDEGDPKKEVAERDAIYTLAAPFEAEKQKLATTALRFRSIDWSDDNFAILNERWFASRQEKRTVINPSQPDAAVRVIVERSYDDIYDDPGSPVYTKNKFGERVLLRKKDDIYMTGEGGSPEGSMPFLATFNTKSKESKTLWKSEAPYYERVAKVNDKNANEFITLRESTDEQPNYWLRATKRNTQPKQVSQFPHPYPELKDIKKELVTYKRKDGLSLSATVYTPGDFDPASDEKLPVLMWAYPREYKSSDIAAQVRGSKYEFTRLSWGSPLYWVTQGYAIMDRTEMPIVGEGDEEPNDYFVEQLVANAEAAIDHIVDGMGIGDRDRIAVGGHSYGAFMTANLLSHTDLFAAGIARSGAYNRTLTPFGFQYEQRTYWEAPEVYNTMSPFMNAEKVKTPILLIHGEADNNSGTFPIQSERYYNALKGHGATTRLVFLPNESHGYAARESILHTLWEQHSWLEKYLKEEKSM